MKKIYSVITFLMIICLAFSSLVYASNVNNVKAEENINDAGLPTEVSPAELTPPSAVATTPSAVATTPSMSAVPSTEELDAELVNKKPAVIEADLEQSINMSDVREKTFEVVSPDGQKTAFIKLNDRDKTIFDDVVVIDNASGKGKVLSLDNVWYTNISNLEWVSDNMVAFTGHVNPSLDVYVVFNVNSGKRINKLDGVGFKWDREKSKIFYSLHRPYFSDGSGTDKVMINDGKELYSSSSDTEILGGPAISNDGTVYFFERDKRSNMASLVKGESGNGKLKKVKKIKWNNPCGEIKINSEDDITVESLHSSDQYNLLKMDQDSSN